MKTLSLLMWVIACYLMLPLSSGAQDLTSSDLNKSYNQVLFPNSSDVVGKIIAIDSKGNLKSITKLNVAAVSNSMEIGEYTKTKNLTWSIVFNFLGLKSLLGTNGSLEGKNNVVKRIAYKGTTQYTMDVLAANQLIQQKRAELQAFANANDLRGMKFYLIIENITAKQVDYGLTKTVSTRDSVDLHLSAIGTANPSVTYNKGTDYQLHYNLPQELTVLYAVLPLKKPAASLTGDGFDVMLASREKTLIKP